MLGNRKWRTENETLKEQYLDALRKQLELQQELDEVKAKQLERERERKEVDYIHEHARRLKHDMRNHLMVIASFLNQGEVEEAKNYTSQIMDKLNLDYSYISTGNTLLNYIVNEKLNHAKKQGIYVKAEIENLKFEGIQSIDFSAILGNLLDNAIEGAKESAKRYVELTIKRQRGYEMIQICNSIDSSVLEKNPNLQTTKEDTASHGIGVAQVRELVEKYDGMLDIFEEENRFIVSVLF